MTIDMTRPVPVTEPERQYHFMDLLKEALDAEQAQIGKARTYSITTMGCQRNARDSEKLKGILERIVEGNGEEGPGRAEENGLVNVVDGIGGDG